ncbi:MAG: tetratricopeptide repeat protein, partial [Myxococcota bacterium]
MAQSALSLPFREQGRLADARAALEEALVHAPSGPHADRARVNLGLVLLELQAPRDAIEVLARAIDGASRRGSSSDLLFPERGLAIAW